MGPGTYINAGLSNMTLGAVGSRPTQVVTYVASPDGTKRVEPAFKESVSFRNDTSMGMAAGTIVGTLGTVAAVGLRGWGSGARSSNAILSAMQGVLSSPVAQTALAGAAIGVGALAATGLAANVLNLTGEPMPGMDWLTDRYKSPTVLQVVYDESGNHLSTQEISRSAFEKEQNAARDDVDVTGGY